MLYISGSTGSVQVRVVSDMRSIYSELFVIIAKCPYFAPSLIRILLTLPTISASFSWSRSTVTIVGGHWIGVICTASIFGCEFLYLCSHVS